MEYLTLSQAAKRLPNRPHAASIWRWCRRGIRSRSGKRIYLEHRRFGGRLFVSDEALDQFGRELAAADAAHFGQQDQAAGRPATPSTRGRRAIEIGNAARELDEAGI